MVTPLTNQYFLKLSTAIREKSFVNIISNEDSCNEILLEYCNSIGVPLKVIYLN